jgi:hypothetical protein
MTYTKPELVLLGPASKAIQSAHMKDGGPLDGIQSTVSAYEADE